MSKYTELQLRRDAIGKELVALSNKESLTDGEQQRWDRQKRAYDNVVSELDELEARKERGESILANKYNEYPGVPGLAQRRELDDIASAALRSLESIDGISARRQAQLETLVRSDAQQAREITVHASDAYLSAFGKLMRYGAATAGVSMTDAERQAVAESLEVRAAAEGTTTAGGFAVPVIIDPSIILTDQETDNPFLNIARVIDVKSNVWKGISAAGMTWSFDAEGAEVSDDMVTLAQPALTVFTARGFIPYSIEIEQDWDGFQSEMSRLLSEGYNELLIDKLTNGNGTSEPQGLLTVLNSAGGASSAHVASVTDGVFQEADVYAVWAALAQKYRNKASWMMHVTANNKIRQMGTSTSLHAQTVQLPAAAASMLFQKPVYENGYFPTFTGTTGVEVRCVVGDFNNFIVGRRAGMSVELVPVLVSGGNNRPMGMRGWFGWARIGSTVANMSAFKVQRNT